LQQVETAEMALVLVMGQEQVVVLALAVVAVVQEVLLPSKVVQ
jgi:hypothetical protein